MSPIGVIFVPSPPKTGTKMLHLRPPPIVERVDFNIYFDGKQKAARKRDGMDRPGRGRPSQEDARSQAPRGMTGTAVTGASAISAGRTLESATSVTDLLRDSGGT